MVDQALPRLVPDSGDPVHHVAAVAGAQRAGLVAVEERVLVLGGGPALLQVLQRAVAPVLADRVGEGLAVTGEIGRASCWARVCQYVEISVVAVSLKKKTTRKNK